MQVVLSNIFCEYSAENFETSILKSEIGNQPKIAGEITKVDSQNLISLLEMLLNELEINASDKFARKMSEMLHHIAQAWRVKTKMVEQLDEALDAINRKDLQMLLWSLNLKYKKGWLPKK